jgi:PAS domain S-box-containing protein
MEPEHQTQNSKHTENDSLDLSSVDFKSIFEALPDLYMILDLDFRIVNISDAYSQSTLVRRNDVVGRGIFEVFPDNPDDPNANGVEQLRASLLKVLNYKVSSTMSMQKYDIRKQNGSGFEVRYWSPKNLPVIDSKGNLTYIIHKVEDVTEFVKLKQQRLEQTEITEEMKDQVAKMEAEVYARAKEAIKSTEELLMSERNLSVTLSSIGDAVLTTDANAIVTRLNPVAEELTGWTEKEALGCQVTKIFNLVNGRTGEPVTTPVLEVIASGKLKGETQNTMLVSRDGSKINISNNCSPIRNRDGLVTGTVLVFRDISEEFLAKAFLEKAKENAELANKAKDSFLATMSHEIRTPLSGLLGMLELLGLTVLSIDQKKMVQNALESGSSLLRILSDILDWSKIEEGKLDLSFQATSIHRLLSEVVTTYSHVASSKGLYLSFKIDPQLQRAHLLDPLRLSQILNNFVSNGIKFTSVGKVEVSAELVTNLTHAQQIKFSVKDTGIGLSPAEQSRLFNSYTQATSDTARLYGGTGLGLAICRRLADLMDGSIELDSQTGVGSTFSITLSIPTIEMDLTDLVSLDDDYKSIEPIVISQLGIPRILVVDDHSVNLELIMQQIELLGLQADGAEDGEKAIKLWHSKKYDLIITDCHMPIKDGYTLAKEIRSIEKARFHKRIPIIAYTANAIGEENNICYAAGMDEILIKPAKISVLRNTLIKWLPDNLKSNFHQVTDTYVESDSPIDFTDLKNIVTEPDRLISLLNRFKIHHQTDLKKLINELMDGNMTDAAHLAHRLKGSCKIAGARDLINGYVKIESFAKENNSKKALIEIEKMKDDIIKMEAYIDKLSNSKENC